MMCSLLENKLLYLRLPLIFTANSFGLDLYFMRLSCITSRTIQGAIFAFDPALENQNHMTHDAVDAYLTSLRSTPV